jgi:hypothetical protein
MTWDDDETEEKDQEQESSDEDGKSKEELEQMDSDDMSAGDKAQLEAKEREEAAERLRELEDDPPTDLQEWPSDKGKYLTFGGADADHGYDEAATRNLGPSEVRFGEDGSVTVEGKKVDNPEDYKGDPIPGGPTDPNVPDSQKGTATDAKEGDSEPGEDDDSGSSDDDES